MKRTIGLLMLAALAGMVTSVRADNPVTWNVNYEDTDPVEDIDYTTPPPTLDGGFPLYEFSYAIVTAEADTTLLGDNIDLTEFLDAEDLTGTGVGEGPLPIMIYDDQVTEDLGFLTIELDVQVFVDEQGQGRVKVTGIEALNEQVTLITRLLLVVDVTVEGKFPPNAAADWTLYE